MKRTFAVMVAGLSLGLAQQAQTGWEVTGTVTYDSKPVKEVFVSISGPQPMFPAKTDGQGRYSVKGVAPGLYSIRVQGLDNTSEPKSRFVTLVNGLRLKVDFSIPKGAIVSGRILDQAKQPVPGVVVLAMRKNVYARGLLLEMKGGDKTNDLGEYRIPNLPEGVYVVAAISKPLLLRKRAPGSGKAQQREYPPMTFYPGTRLLDAALAFEVRSGGERPGLDLVIGKVPTRCLSFKVEGTLPDSRTPSQTYLGLHEWAGAEGPTLAEGPVKTQEQYEICGLAPGEYRFQIRSFSNPPPRSIGYVRAVAIVDRQDVDLGSVVLVATAEVRGTVVVKDAKPGEMGICLTQVAPTDCGFVFGLAPG